MLELNTKLELDTMKPTELAALILVLTRYASNHSALAGLYQQLDTLIGSQDAIALLTEMTPVIRGTK